MEDPIKSVSAGFFEATFAKLGLLRFDWIRKRRLKKKLQENRIKFPKGFRSTSRLMADIQADRDTTVRLPMAIGARKSETSDEWKL
ncbi:hypothetical protein IWQ54_005455 [Labrenzia sp. EL_195]|nr:hypothetical protein [Labrenzia sp. EL_195]